MKSKDIIIGKVYKVSSNYFKGKGIRYLVVKQKWKKDNNTNSIGQGDLFSSLYCKFEEKIGSTRFTENFLEQQISIEENPEYFL